MNNKGIRFGFVLSRKKYLHYLGSLIDYVYEKGHEITIFFQLETKEGQEIELSFLIEMLGGKYNYVPFQEETFELVARNSRIDTMIFLEGPRFFFDANILHVADNLRREGIRLVSVACYYDTCVTPFNALEKFDLICLYNDQRHILKEVLKFQIKSENLTCTENDIKSFINNKTVVTGLPPYDDFKRIDRNMVLERYKIPKDKKVVLLMIPFFNYDEVWRQQVWLPRSFVYRFFRALKYRYIRVQYIPDMIWGMSFKQFVKQIKTFCLRNNAVLITKGRVKNRGPEIDIVERIADYNFGDEEVYPIDTTFQLISIADLVITTRSSAIMECIYANVPVVHVLIPHLRYNKLRVGVYYDIIFNLAMRVDRDSCFRFDGCFDTIELRKIREYLKTKRIEDIKIDQKRRSEYLNGFGMKEGVNASEAIYNAIHKIIK